MVAYIIVYFLVTTVVASFFMLRLVKKFTGLAKRYSSGKISFKDALDPNYVQPKRPPPIYEKFSDEEFFDEILKLPDEVFKMVTQQIRSSWHHGGLSIYISKEKASTIVPHLKALIEMGLLPDPLKYLRYNPKMKEIRLVFNTDLIGKRLSKRRDLMEKLNESAQKRNIKVYIN